jgi:hypothetical protein
MSAAGAGRTRTRRSTGARSALRPSRRRDAGRARFVEVSLGELRTVPRRDLYLRFAFGAAISTVASVVAILLGVRAGGLLLAFPAILPATLTLIEREDTHEKAMEDDVGSVLGAVSLAGFAALAWWLLRTAGAVVALPVACAGWFVSSLALYAVVRAVFGTERP